MKHPPSLHMPPEPLMQHALIATFLLAVLFFNTPFPVSLGPEALQKHRAWDVFNCTMLCVFHSHFSVTFQCFAAAVVPAD
jgi:hypothetical protein